MMNKIKNHKVFFIILLYTIILYITLCKIELKQLLNGTTTAQSVLIRQYLSFLKHYFHSRLHDNENVNKNVITGLKMFRRRCIRDTSALEERPEL